MRIWIGALLVGILIFIIVLSSKRRVLLGESEKNTKSAIVQEVRNPHKNSEGFQPSNSSRLIEDSRRGDESNLINLKNIVKTAHPAAAQLADLLEKSGLDDREAAQLFVGAYNDLTRIRQIEDMVAKDWTERTIEIVQLEGRTDISEASKRQEYYSLSASLHAVSNEMRREQSEIRNRLLETVGVPRSMESNTFRSLLLSIYPRGPLPDLVLREIESATKYTIKNNAP